MIHPDPTTLIAKLSAEISTNAHFTKPLRRKLIADIISALQDLMVYRQIQRPSILTTVAHDTVTVEPAEAWMPLGLESYGEMPYMLTYIPRQNKIVINDGPREVCFVLPFNVRLFWQKSTIGVEEPEGASLQSA